MNSRFETGVDMDTAEKIIKRIIASVWRFRKPRTEKEHADLVETWRDALNFSKSTYPANIYLDAVTSWLSDATEDTNPPMPGDILAHCSKVMERIAADPERGPKMRAWLEARREARIDQLAGDA